MKTVAKIVHYGARTLAVLFAAFLSVFILEGFDPSFGWQSGVAHAIPAAFAIALAVIAFKRPRLGGWLYVAIALVFMSVIVATILMTQEGQALSLITLIINPLPGFIAGIGVLFLVDARLMKQDKGSGSGD
ncbi:MAG: hypothetical protein ABH838_02060 [Actinomycetota bacterium]